MLTLSPSHHDRTLLPEKRSPPHPRRSRRTLQSHSRLLHQSRATCMSVPENYPVPVWQRICAKLAGASSDVEPEAVIVPPVLTMSR